MGVDLTKLQVPATRFLVTLLQERFPDIRVTEGSAIHDAIVRPASVSNEDLRRIANVIRRNLSVNNAPRMDEAELDDLGANIVLERGTGARAFGVQRVFFVTPQAFSIGPGAVFSDAGGLRWVPSSAISGDAATMSANQDQATLEFFVDVQIIAENVGAELLAEAGQITTVTGVVGAVRTTNPNALAGGADPQSNADFAGSFGAGITNRDLVARTGIEIALRNAFPSVIRSVQVVGLGDPAMQRDVVRAVVAFSSLFQRSFAGKVNVPLNSDGDVQHLDETGNIIPPAASIGGQAGAIYDLTGLDFFDLEVTQDGIRFHRTAVVPGMRFQLFQGAGFSDDSDVGERTIRRVVQAPAIPNGPTVTLALLDEPFENPDPSQAIVDDINKYPYRLDGQVFTNTFHQGGRIDAIVDTTSDEERSVTVSRLEETVLGSSVFEIPISSGAEALANGDPLYEDATPFVDPVIEISSVELLSGTTGEEIDRVMQLGTDFTVIRASARSEFDQDAQDVVRITQAAGSTEVLVGRRVKIRYITNPDIPAMQQFADAAEQENLAGDLQIRPAKIALMDVAFSYRGTLAQADAEAIVQEFINQSAVGGTITAFDISTIMALFGVIDIVDNDITLTSQTTLDNGQIQANTSTDRLTAAEGAKFRPATTLTILKVG